VNEGQRQRTGSLSLQAKSGASTAGAASRQTSSRHILLYFMYWIHIMIHFITSYTKFIVLIHIINSLQAASTCLSWNTRITRGKGSLGVMPFALSVWNECKTPSMKMNNISMLIHCMISYYEICTWINYMVK
jgi:hypothetical protein